MNRHGRRAMLSWLPALPWAPVDAFAAIPPPAAPKPLPMVLHVGELSAAERDALRAG